MRSRPGGWPSWPVLVEAALLAALGGLAAWRADWGALAGITALAGFRATAATLGRPEAAPRVPEPRAAPPTDRSLLAALPEPVVLVDARQVVAAVNGAALEVAPSLRVAQPLSLAIRAPEVLEAVAGTLRTGEAAIAEWSGRAPGEATWRVLVRPLDGGPRPGAVLVFHDLTEQRRSETVRSDFVAHVSHELRTPLASILGFVETLQGPARDDPAARARFLGIISSQARRMKRLVDDLLQLSRLEMRARQAPTATVDLRAAIGHMVELLGPLARERDVTVELGLPEARAEVVGDRDELLRLVENLLSNAIRYGGSGGRVEIGLARGPGPDEVELTVRDHGPGIAPEHLPRLTERFFRADVAGSRAEGGTGLGLAIVKHIVGRHRGRLLIESEPGLGATFRVRLPAAATR